MTDKMKLNREYGMEACEVLYPSGNIDHIRILLDSAFCISVKRGQPFKTEEYKWVLGVNIIRELENNLHYIMAEFPDRPRTLFGIVIEADYHNPNNIELWENITNKL